jgi:transcriptional regulator GlxA family with amidase domain
VQVALTLFPGVSADECEAFTLVFDQLAEAELVGVGATTGPVVGPGGGHHIDARFAEVQHPDIVLVPGGLGCARTALDEPLLDWLRTVAPRCQWMAASSTGTVIVAAAGLLDDHEAATHWLASGLLESFGSPASDERVVEIGRIITCEGRITAMHVALLVTLRVGGPEALARARSGLAAGGTRPEIRPSRWQLWLGARSARRRRGPSRPRNRELDAPEVIEFDPITPDRRRW